MKAALFIGAWVLAAAAALPCAECVLAALPPPLGLNPVSRGLVFGLCLGAPQAWLLRHRIPRPWRWASGAVLGWVLGLCLQGAAFIAAVWLADKPNTAALMGDAGLGWKFCLAFEWGVPGLLIGAFQARLGPGRAWPWVCALAFALSGMSLPGAGLLLLHLFRFGSAAAGLIALAFAGAALGAFSIPRVVRLVVPESP